MLPQYYIVWVMSNGQIISQYFRRKSQAMEKLESLRSDPSCLMANGQFFDEDKSLIFVRDFWFVKNSLMNSILKDSI